MLKRRLLCGFLLCSTLAVPLHAWAAATDAAPRPLYGVAYRIYAPLLDADGDLVTGASSPDCEISKDGGTFADCTNEITEIATNSGMYFLDLTATEMQARAIALILKSGNAKTTPITLYPELILARCVVGSSSTTTSIITSAITPPAAVTDQFKGRIVLFEAETTTANLRGQGTAITASTSGGVLTVQALTTAPVSGDRCMIQ